jgi:hypothetical protein
MEPLIPTRRGKPAAITWKDSLFFYLVSLKSGEIATRSGIKPGVMIAAIERVRPIVHKTIVDVLEMFPQEILNTLGREFSSNERQLAPVPRPEHQGAG